MCMGHGLMMERKTTTGPFGFKNQKAFGNFDVFALLRVDHACCAKPSAGWCCFRLLQVSSGNKLLHVGPVSAINCWEQLVQNAAFR